MYPIVDALAPVVPTTFIECAATVVIIESFVAGEGLMRLMRNLGSSLLCLLLSGLAIGSGVTENLVGDDTVNGRSRPTSVSDSPFYVDPGSAAANWVSGNPADPKAAVLRDKIARQPQGKWVGEWTPDVRQAVSAYTGAAAKAGKTPILVAYNIPGRDCGQFSSGGAGSAEAYKTWIRNFAGVSGNIRQWSCSSPTRYRSYLIVKRAQIPNSSRACSSLP